jgi:hypothetical protein
MVVGGGPKLLSGQSLAHDPEARHHKISSNGWVDARNEGHGCEIDRHAISRRGTFRHIGVPYITLWITPDLKGRRFIGDEKTSRYGTLIAWVFID